MIKSYKKGVRTQLSSNFTSAEFDCHGKGCCSDTFIDSDLVGYLQMIRANFSKPVTVTSGYRCIKHNKAVGGVLSSKHLEGAAADIKVEGVIPAKVAQYAESIGVKGIGLYETDSDGYFVHIDTRAKKGFWYGQKQEPRDTFGGRKVPLISVKEWQLAAISDGFKFPKYGADGAWGGECIAVAKKAICKKRLTYKYKNLTRLIQKALGITVDGKFGNDTKAAVIAWQKANGLTADGAVGLNSWIKLLGV